MRVKFLIFLNIFLQLSKEKSYTYLPPTQGPINPPYKEAVLLKRQNKLAKPQVHISHLPTVSDDSLLKESPSCQSSAIQEENCEVKDNEQISIDSLNVDKLSITSNGNN